MTVFVDIKLLRLQIINVQNTSRRQCRTRSSDGYRRRRRHHHHHHISWYHRHHSSHRHPSPRRPGGVFRRSARTKNDRPVLHDSLCAPCGSRFVGETCGWDVTYYLIASKCHRRRRRTTIDHRWRRRRGDRWTGRRIIPPTHRPWFNCYFGERKRRYINIQYHYYYYILCVLIMNAANGKSRKKT